jgi:hypothetical protein
LKFRSLFELPAAADGPRLRPGTWFDHVEITLTCATCCGEESAIYDIGVNMTAELILFDNYRPAENDAVEAIDRLFSAMGQYRSAELLELLYVGQEPGFFDLIRGLFALPEESRLALQQFLTTAAQQRTSGAIDPDGRLVLQRRF